MMPFKTTSLIALLLVAPDLSHGQTPHEVAIPDTLAQKSKPHSCILESEWNLQNKKELVDVETLAQLPAGGVGSPKNETPREKAQRNRIALQASKKVYEVFEALRDQKAERVEDAEWGSVIKVPESLQSIAPMGYRVAKIFWNPTQVSNGFAVLFESTTGSSAQNPPILAVKGTTTSKDWISNVRSLGYSTYQNLIPNEALRSLAKTVASGTSAV